MQCRPRNPSPTRWGWTSTSTTASPSTTAISRTTSRSSRSPPSIRQELARLASGHLPSTVDEEAFLARINDGIRDVASTGDHEATVAVFSHGGVINGLLHSILRTERILCVNVDYAGITRLLSSRKGDLYVASVNGTEHVWDLLPRNQRW